MATHADLTDQLTLDRRFDTKADAAKFVAELAREHRFQTKVDKSDKTRLRLVCKTEDCHWYVLFTSVYKNSDEFRLSTCEAVHTCAGSLGVSTTAEHAATLMAVRVANTPNYAASQLQKDLAAEHGIHVNYHKAWHAHEKARAAAFGTPEEGFYKLAPYIQNLGQKNVLRGRHEGFSAAADLDVFTMVSASCQLYHLLCAYCCVFLDRRWQPTRLSTGPISRNFKIQRTKPSSSRPTLSFEDCDTCASTSPSTLRT